MLEKTSPDFRTFFLLQFTKELIFNSIPEDVFVEKNLNKEIMVSQPVKEVIKPQPVLIERTPKKINVKEISGMSMSIPKPFLLRKQIQRNPNELHVSPRGLHIPDPQLPPNLQYLRPVPTNLDLDLGELNSLVRDPAVKVIECDGADKKIVVRGNMGIKFTDVALSKSEIDGVIEKFSFSAKIPVHEGVFKIVVGKLILTAIVSEVISSKFIIKKMVLPIGNFLR